MGYSTAPIVVTRNMHFLLPLLEAEGSPLTWHVPGKARWLAHRIYSALAAARANSEIFPDVAELQQIYRISVVDPDTLQAIPRSSTVSAEPLLPQTDVAAQGIAHIKHLWRTTTPRGRLHLPTVRLSEQQLADLWLWGQAEDALIFEDSGAITLLPLEGNEDLVSLAYRPISDDASLPAEEPVFTERGSTRARDSHGG